jgi:L-alanine-DL-glutamate epimerase-like enolase superfamily enzyme
MAAASSPALLIGFGEGKPTPGAPTEESSRSLAGKALKKALLGDDGEAIADAWDALQRESDDAASEEEEPVAEPPEAA